MIAVAVAEADGEVRSLGIIPNRDESILKLVRKLGPAEQLQSCYEAGPTGYVLWVKCEGWHRAWYRSRRETVKTDRRGRHEAAAQLSGGGEGVNRTV